MVVYDTGSDWLTVKSCLSGKHCHKKVDEEKTLEKLANSSKNGALANAEKVPKPGSGAIMTVEASYNQSKTLTGFTSSPMGFPLSYGSADL
jgi:hypothetical protein